ncbi:hypothetical protein BKA66DRAFT_450387 [Pyrenochaeta sp. MPI-SDFR-AT-0127]|nr:hypothetical protein BKA66DRAFT_450387 [Pyrenochaeta sp. MPI-SDFR-AT-0127]
MYYSFSTLKFRYCLIVTYTLVASYAHHCIALPDRRTCYDSSNALLTTHRPCVDPSIKAISHCCSAVDTCLGDTLCLSQWGTLYVGVCTVKDWPTGNNGRGDCPKYCRLEGEDIGLCNNTEPEWEFCCSPLKGIENCCTGKRFKIQNTTDQYLDQRPWASNKVCSRDTEAQIGLGIGLGIPLLIALCLLVWERHKRRAAQEALQVL